MQAFVGYSADRNCSRNSTEKDLYNFLWTLVSSWEKVIIKKNVWPLPCSGFLFCNMIAPSHMGSCHAAICHEVMQTRQAILTREDITLFWTFSLQNSELKKLLFFIKYLKYLTQVFRYSYKKQTNILPSKLSAGWLYLRACFQGNPPVF